MKSHVILTVILATSFLACEAPPKTPQTTTSTKVVVAAKQKPKAPVKKPSIVVDAQKPFIAAFERRQRTWRQWRKCFGYDRLVVCLMGTEGGGDGQIVLGEGVPQFVVMSHVGKLTHQFHYKSTLFTFKRQGENLMVRGPVLPVILTPREIEDNGWVERLTSRKMAWQLAHFGKAIVLVDSLNKTHMDAILVLGKRSFAMGYIDIEDGTVVHNKQVTVDGVHYHYTWPDELKINGVAQKHQRAMADEVAPLYGAKRGRVDMTDQWQASDLIKKMKGLSKENK